MENQTAKTNEVAGIDTLTFQRMSEHAVLPKYANDGDTGMDLVAAANVLLMPQERRIIPTDLAVQFPRHVLHDFGYRWGGMIRPRSGLTSKTEFEVKIGTVDNTYRGSIGVIAKNEAQMLNTIGTVTECVGRDEESVVVDITVNPRTGVVRDLKGNEVYRSELSDLYVAGDLQASQFNARLSGAILVRRGDRIAQLVLEEIVRPLQIKEGTVNQVESRGGGFGSTGVGC